MRRNPVKPLAAGLAAVALALGVGGCAKDAETVQGSTTTANVNDFFGEHTVVEGPLTGCVNKGPGVILTEAEAIVRFDPSAVCPGYVTVLPGTVVSFVNLDTAPHTVTISRGTPTAPRTADPGTTATSVPTDSDTVTIEPGATYKRPFGDVGTFTYTTDALPSFRGIVEVTTSTAGPSTATTARPSPP